MRRRALTAVLATAVVALAGCSGVPASSHPQVLESIPAAEPQGPPVSSPAPGADPRSIVLGFLAANAATDKSHAAARAFLTPEAKNRWSDSTVTVIDSPQVGNPTKNQVTARARVIGTIDASGVYTPKLQGNGEGGGEAAVSFTFGLTHASGQWRISQLQNGLLLDATTQFQRYYLQRRIYFFDLAERHLVPDPRYTSLTNSTLLANWLVTQLAQGPRPQLQNAVKTELPTQTTPKVTFGDSGQSVDIEIPGARQLDPLTRNRLAAQLALTLGQVNSSWVFTITDGGTPVSIPSVSGPQFSVSDFPDVLVDNNANAQLYYIRRGAVMTSAGKPMPGPLGSSSSGLHSVALAARNGSKDLLAAGTAGPAGKYRLMIGSQLTGLHKAGLVGALSRPAWAPGLDEVWVGDGSEIYRVTKDGKPVDVPATASSGKLSGAVTSLAFSPEGSRVALVLSAKDGGAQLWIGAVVRSGSQVRVDSLQPISPAGVTAVDAAWNDELKLFVAVSQPGYGGGLYEVQCDGSVWKSRSTNNLPGTPDSITVAGDHPAAVSTGSTVWEQKGDTWVGIVDGASTSGTKPTYTE